MLLVILWLVIPLARGSGGLLNLSVFESVGTWDSVCVADAVGHVCQQAASLLILCDGSPSAMGLLHFLLTHDGASSPRQVANLLTWHQDPWHYYRHRHNSASGLTLVLIHNASSLQALEALEPGWVYGPILLVALNPHQDFRDALLAVNSARYSSLVQPVALQEPGKYGVSLTTLFPFNPPSRRFDVQVLPAEVPLTQQQLLTDRFANFEGHTLELASWIDEFPVLHWSNGTNSTALGMALTMLNVIADRLNFTYTIQDEPPDGQWAEIINGTWTGLAGQLVKREKHLVINTLALMYDRVAVMDFSVAVTTDSYSVVLRLPPSPPCWQAVFYPFITITWSALAATVIIITFFFHLLISTDSSVVYNHKIDVVSTLVWMTRVLLSLAVPHIPSSPGTRPFLVCWWLMSLVLAASYVTNIIAYITVPDPPAKINTLRELANSIHPLYMGDYGTFVPRYLSTSHDPVYRRLSQKLHLIQNYSEIKNYVLENNGAFIEGTAYMEYEISSWPVRGMYYLQETLFPYTTAWAFQKGTPWVDTFNRYLRRMVESGLVDRWRNEEILRYRKSQGRVTTKERSTRRRLRPLSLEDLQSAFYILGLGYLISTLTVGIEVAYNNHSNFRLW